MNLRAADGPGTVELLVPLVPELVVFLLVVAIVAFLAYSILRVHERHLERDASDKRRPADRIADVRHAGDNERNPDGE